MNLEVKSRTGQILTVMKILAWLAFIGFMFKAGAVLVTTVISIVKPEASSNLYEGLNLHQLQQENVWFYGIVAAMVIILNSVKAIIWYMAIELINHLKLENPFSIDMAHRLEYISYSLFTIWLVSVTSGGFIAWLGDLAGNLNDSWDHGEFLFMAGIAFIISQIFKRGVEIQSESDLTV